MAFMTLALAQTWHLGTARSRESLLGGPRAWSNPFALAGVGAALALQGAAAFIGPLARVLSVVRWIRSRGCWCWRPRRFPR